MFSYPNYSAKQNKTKRRRKEKEKYPFRDRRYEREKKQDGKYKKEGKPKLVLLGEEETREKEEVVPCVKGIWEMLL